MNTKELEKQTNSLEKTVHDLAIISREDYRLAEGLTKDCIELEEKIKGFFESAKKAAHDAHKKVVAMESNQLSPVTKLKQLLKTKMTGYIELENAYTDGVNAFQTAVKTAESALEFADNEELAELLEYAKEKARLGRDEVLPQEFLSDALETLRKVESFTGYQEEVKKEDTGLRKLTASYRIESVNFGELLKAVVDGKAGGDWVHLNESAVLASAKGKETQEEVDKVFAGTGIKVIVERSLR